MTEIPEHLRKRAEDARAKAAAERAGGTPVTPERGFSTTQIPPHLLERARRRREEMAERPEPETLSEAASRTMFEDWERDRQDPPPSPFSVPAPGVYTPPVAHSEPLAPRAPVDDGWSNYRLPWHKTLWGGILSDLLLLMPVSFIGALPPLFVSVVLLRNHQLSYIESVRWTYIITGTLATIAEIVTWFGVGVMARKLGVPRKAFEAAVYEHKLSKDPGFKQWNGDQLLDEIRLAANKGKYPGYGRPLIRPSRR